jgi:thiol-disulfide isomerase/thioredoxin
MSFFSLNFLKSGSLAVAFSLVGLFAPGQLQAQGKKTEKAAPPAPKKEETKKDPFAVPDGKPAELVKYMQLMQSRSRRARSLAEFKKHQNAILGAADKILAQKSSATIELTTIKAKFTALGLLTRFGDSKAAKTLQTFAEKLKNDKRKPIADLAAQQLLTARARRVFALKPAERKELADDVIKYLAGGDVRTRFSVAMTTARGLESAGSRELAATTYTKMSEILAKSKDEKLKNYAKKMEGSARRVMLLGNSIDIKGQTADGKPFKWSDYKGKVVLIDFWATWCGPCIRELPNVKNMYKKYHDKGFEVVGISLDRSKGKLDTFIKTQKLEWTNLYSADPKTTGWDHPMATYYGVMSIPNVILVDQNGKVVSLKARGAELQRQLDKLLGDAKKTNK